MRIEAYLERTGETAVAFSKRSGVPLTTLNRVLSGNWIGMRTAQKIVTATGGQVRLEHLLPPPTTARGVKRRAQGRAPDLVRVLLPWQRVESVAADGRTARLACGHVAALDLTEQHQADPQVLVRRAASIPCEACAS